MFLCPENSELPCLILLRLEFYQRKTNLSYSHMCGDKYKSPNYMVSRAHISYRHHCAPHESGLSSCCTQPYYREIDCQKVSSSFPECAQTSWPVDYSSLVRRRCFCPCYGHHTARAGIIQRHFSLHGSIPLDEDIAPLPRSFAKRVWYR